MLALMCDGCDVCESLDAAYEEAITGRAMVCTGPVARAARVEATLILRAMHGPRYDVSLAGEGPLPDLDDPAVWDEMWDIVTGGA